MIDIESFIDALEDTGAVGALTTVLVALDHADVKGQQ